MGVSTVFKERIMSRVIARSIKQHPVKMTLGLIINASGVLAVLAHL